MLWNYFYFVLYLLLFIFIISRNHPQHVQPLPVHVGPEFDQVAHDFDFFLHYRFVTILDLLNPPISHDDHQSQ